MNDNAVFRHLAALADPTRARLLQVLERHELTVSELCSVVQLPQSTVSRHLRILSDADWLTSRAEGPSRHYRLAGGLAEEGRRLWDVVREPLAGTPEASQDAARAREVVHRRRTRSQEFFSSAAGQWDSVRAELFGEAPERHALLALLDPTWEVGDLGCGTGRVAVAVAPYVRRVVAVDESPDMLEAARRRVASPGPGARGAGTGSVELKEGRLEALPLGDGSLDVALLFLVLHYVAEPARALTEARRVLRPGGRLLVVDMVAHGRSEYRDRMGHLWLGFERGQVEGWLEGAGFGQVGYHQLPTDASAKGPMLFAAVAAASAEKRQNNENRRPAE